MATFAPIPRASERIATVAKPGFLPRIRMAKQRFRQRCHMSFGPTLQGSDSFYVYVNRGVVSSRTLADASLRANAEQGTASSVIFGALGPRATSRTNPSLWFRVSQSTPNNGLELFLTRFDPKCLVFLRDPHALMTEKN